MTRTIAFRAWDKEEGRMYFQEHFMNGDNDDRARWANIIFDTDEREHVIMQYTGLKDKNGLADIYEGDIVKYYYDTYRGSDDIVGVITFSEGQYWIDCQGQMISIASIGDEESLELLGNEYQNPDLIKN